MKKRYKKIQYKMPSAFFLKWTTELLNNCHDIVEKSESTLCSRIENALTTMLNKRYSGRHENIFNDDLRDLLEQSYKNHVTREDRQGYSANENEAGEIDLTIYIDNKQYAIIEGLKSDPFKIDSSSIHEHMNKMINKYDTQGLPFLILIVYVVSSQHSYDYNCVSDKIFNHFKLSVPVEMRNNIKKRNTGIIKLASYVSINIKTDIRKRIILYTVHLYQKP